MPDACFFTSAVIFGEQFLREGRVITGGTCNNLTNYITKLFLLTLLKDRVAQ
jgi:hypothetical protein